MKKDWFRSLLSRFEVETVHNCDCFSEVWSELHRCISAGCVQCDLPVFLISLELLRRWTFLCQFIHLDFWVAKHEKLDLVGSDSEFHQISFWYISSAQCGPRNAVSVPQFCWAEHHEVAPYWWRSAGLRKHPVAIGENVGWIRFPSRDVHKCNKLFLDSNKKHSEHCTFGIVLHNSNIIAHFTNHRFRVVTEWVVVVILLQFGLMTLDLLHELQNAEVFCLFHNCMWQSRQSQVTLCEQIDGLFTFNGSLRSYLICVYVFVCVLVLIWTFNRHWHTTGNRSLCSCMCAFAVKQDTFVEFLSTRTGWLLCRNRSTCSYNCFLVFGWVCGESSPPPATSEPNSFIQSCFKEIFGGGRGDAKTFSYMISPVSIMIPFGIT